MTYYEYNENGEGEKMENWLTLKETCEILDLAPHTVYKLVRTGRLPAYEIEGVRGMKFKRADVETLIQPVKVKPEKQKKKK